MARSSPTPTNPRAVLFDIDHTLFDTDGAERHALRAALAGHGLPCSRSTLQAYRRINEALWDRYRRREIDSSSLARERFRQLLAQVGGDPERAESLGEAYLEKFSRHVRLLPGCRRTLARLKKRFHLGIVTNGIDRVQRSRLRTARLEGFFRAVITSEGCGFAKPDPRIIQAALRALEVDPAEALYVGDDLTNDGAAARAAGVAFCWMDRRRAPEGDLPASCRRVARLEDLLVLLNT